MSREASDHELRSGRHSWLWKAAAWVSGILITLLLVAGIALTILLHSARFHNYVLSTVEKKASESIGTRCRTLSNCFSGCPPTFCVGESGVTSSGNKFADVEPVCPSAAYLRHLIQPGPESAVVHHTAVVSLPGRARSK